MNHNRGAAPDHVAFELGLEGDARRYVGFRRCGDDIIAKPRSPLERFLADGAKILTGTLPGLSVTRTEALALVSSRRRQAISEGFRLVVNQAVSPWPAPRSIKLVLPTGEVHLYQSQREFGRTLGIPGTTVRKWMGSRDRVDFDDLAELGGRIDFEALLRPR